jgi:adenylate cyclase class 2
MASNQEIEIKFRVENPRTLARRLRDGGFRLVTKRTHEMNTLYDLPGEVLRNRKELLRLRKYGPDWTLTHKSKGRVKTHSSREELETAVSDGKKMDLILRALGYSQSFRYEKFRAEWTDGKGQVVVDPRDGSTRSQKSSEWIKKTTSPQTMRGYFCIGRRRQKAARKR